jgi:hypothetical protein
MAFVPYGFVLVRVRVRGSAKRGVADDKSWHEEVWQMQNSKNRHEQGLQADEEEQEQAQTGDQVEEHA